MYNGFQAHSPAFSRDFSGERSTLVPYIFSDILLSLHFRSFVYYYYQCLTGEFYISATIRACGKYNLPLGTNSKSDCEVFPEVFRPSFHFTDVLNGGDSLLQSTRHARLIDNYHMSSSPPPSDPIRNDNVPPGYVRLILVWEQKSPFYLEIPVEVISSLCLKPRKYLIFLGWCILGTAGWLTSCRGSEEIETDEALDDGGSYYYVTSDSEAAGR